jgi:hypothetical protein
MYMPPFTPICWPVMKLALSEQRKTQAAAMSSDVPARRTGMTART